MYELLCIIPAQYTVDELKVVISKIEAIIKNHTATVEKSQNLGNLKLAYPIKKQNHSYYVTIDFSGEAINLLELNKELRLEKDISRFILTKKSKIAKDVRPVEFEKIDPSSKKSTFKTDFVKRYAKVKDKIKLDEIDDKKLDEILEKEIV